VPTGSRPLALLYWSLAVTTLLAGAVVLSTFWVGMRQQAQDDSVRHTLAVRNQVAQVVTLLQRTESAQRGYLLTGRDLYLKPYDASVQAMPKALDDMAALVVDNPHQQQQAGRMRQLVIEKLRELGETIEARKAGRTEVAFAALNTDFGQRLMDDFRALVATMEREEDRLLAERQASATTLGRLLQGGAALAFVLICAAGALGSSLTRRAFGELGAAHDELVKTNEALVDQAAQRMAAESQLRQSQKMEAIGQLSGGIAHDFNNMLGVIGGSLELIKRRIDKGDYRVERYMDAAMQGTDRAAALTHRLLAFARQQPLAPEPVDANKMISTMSELLRSTLGEHVRIETVNAGGLWLTTADAHQLENAILNVAINARDAMPDGGRLTIETANAYLDDAYARAHGEVEPGQYVLVAITDTGTGMPPEVAARAFDPFFTTKPTGAGTGLGLSQVYGFVKQSRGHIKIYSEIGAGTTVKIYLPRHHGDAAPAPKDVAAMVQGGSADQVILLAEDDPLMRRMATEALRELGYTVLDCDGAAAALATLASRNDVTLLFTDVVMPDINGKKLVEEALRRRPGLKVLYTTGYTPNAVVHGGVLDAGVELLTKPFTLEQLAAKVKSALAKA
jgi:signal transduction histidine kinase/ActR/RegA family two-component response regulator